MRSTEGCVVRWVYNRSPQPVSHMGYGAFMSSEISQRELRNNSGDIMRRLDEGEAFIVTRNGVPVGELVPLRRRRVVNGPALAAAFRDTSVVIDLDVIAPDDLPDEASVSAVTMAELSAGPHATDDPAERARRQDRLQQLESWVVTPTISWASSSF